MAVPAKKTETAESESPSRFKISIDLQWASLTKEFIDEITTVDRRQSRPPRTRLLERDVVVIHVFGVGARIR